MEQAVDCISETTLDKFNKGCNFKSDELSYEALPNLKEAMLNDICFQANDYSIAVDWLEVFCQSESLYGLIMSEELDDKEAEYMIRIDEKYELVYQGHGTKLYEYLFFLRIDKIDFAIIQAIPRKCVGKMTDFAVSIRVLNHELYQVGFSTKLSAMLYDLRINMLNITRVDVAIDNANHISDFLLKYIRQDNDNQHIIYAGKFDISFMKMRGFQSFEAIHIGSAKSDRAVSIYNKAAEIKRSNKDYIYKFWQSNLHSFDEEKVIRVEVRLKSKELGKVKNIELNDLENESILKELFVIGSRGMFDFRLNDNPNISRCTKLNMLNVTLSSGKLIHMTEKYIPNDIYKAKISIHIIYKLRCSSKISRWEHSYLQELCDFFINKYNLSRWYVKKKEKWREIYGRTVVF